MLTTFLLLLALQDASAPPRDAPAPPCPPGLSGLACAADNPMGRSSGPSCSVNVTGHLLYPAYATSIPHTSVDITVIPPTGPPYTMDMIFTDAWNQFRVSLWPSPLFEYWVSVNAEGMGTLRQKLFVPRECKPDPGISLDILLHPAVKPSDGSEDTVAVESLARKVPDKVLQTFDKSMDKKSITTLQEVLNTAPDYYEANLELGLEYKKTDRQEDAIRTLTHALEINSGSMLARSALGQYSFEADDFQGAINLLSEAVRLGSMSPDDYYMLGTSYYKLGQLDLAEAYLARALSINPTIGKAYLQLYNVYMRAKLPERALQAVDTYLEKYPKTGDHDYVQSMADKLRKTLKP